MALDKYRASWLKALVYFHKKKVAIYCRKEQRLPDLYLKSFMERNQFGEKARGLSV